LADACDSAAEGGAPFAQVPVRDLGVVSRGSCCCPNRARSVVCVGCGVARLCRCGSRLARATRGGSGSPRRTAWTNGAGARQIRTTYL